MVPFYNLSMMIRGKSCTLTAARDGYYFPLKYSEETIRAKSKGYALPGVVGGTGRERIVRTGVEAAGCFVCFLDRLCAPFLFRLASSGGLFDIYADRVFERKIYRNLTSTGFELRADSGGAFCLRVDVKDSPEFFVDSWGGTVPSFGAGGGGEIFVFDGHGIYSDEKKLPLVYRIELSAEAGDVKKFNLKIYFPISDEHFPKLAEIERLSVPLGKESEIELSSLVPYDELAGINASGAVLACQKFKVLGKIKITAADGAEKTEVEL